MSMYVDNVSFELTSKPIDSKHSCCALNMH